MIHCVIKKPEEYTTSLGTGLWQSYGHDPHLFSLLSRTTSAFFFYEPGLEDISEGDRIVTLGGIETWEQSLNMDIGTMPIRELLETHTPRDLTDLVMLHKPKHLPLYQMMEQAAGNPDAMWFGMYLRTLQYEKYFRGVTRKEGKVVQAVFRSNLNKEENTFLERQIKILREEIRKRMGV